jgi:anaerobic selenocysteine-containing dehydrogenase
MAMTNESHRPDPTRRAFLSSSAFLGGSAVALGAAPLAGAFAGEAEAAATGTPEYGLGKPENFIHSVCLNCNTGCGVRVKTENGVVVKIDGNPYDPWNTIPPVDYKTPLAESGSVEGALCPKGQSGVQILYDPYRLVKVLKRAGKRGEGKWTTIPFRQAVKEIAEGGALFKGVAGETTRNVTGLKELWALRDPKLAAEMSKEVDAIRAKKTPEEKKAAVEAFKTKFEKHLGLLIDPDHPDFGPKNNHVTFAWGRLKAGRSELIKRFVSESFGSTNAHGHTTVCQGSLYFTGKAMSDQFTEGKLTGGQKFYWQADTGNVEFLLAIGSAYIEGGYGPTHHAKKMMERIASGKLKVAVVDPRFSKIASKAWRWVPAKPGTEAALALGMIRWILENDRHDKKFLSAANKAAAKAAGEQSWTNAAWLVKEDGSFLRASEAGLALKETRYTKDGKPWELDAFVVSSGGSLVAFDPNDEKTAVTGDLLVETTVAGKKVKSGLKLLLESSQARTNEQWADVCGIAPETITDLAKEFTSYGKRAVADPHRGVSQHTNGFYNVLAVYSLNALVGNWDWKGGLVKATTYGVVGDKEGQPFDFGKLHPSKAKPFGLSIIRHDAKYEESTIFAGYPAKRNWYPFSSDVYQEILPSIADAYPYATKALFLYMAAPTYSLPGGQTNIQALLDLEKLPLVVASDITVGETSMYADYLFPDLSFLERWEFQGSHPSVPQKVQPVRNPAAAPIPEVVEVFGEKVPCSLEAMILGIAEEVGLPGFGPEGLGKGMALTRPEDFYLKMVANLAFGDKPGDGAADASDEEVALFLKARRHLPATVFDAARWEAAAGPGSWRKVVTVLNRGGRFQEYGKAFDGEKYANKYGKQINLYLEKYAKAKSPMTGKKLPGIATYLPIQDVLGREVKDESEGFDLVLTTYREIHQTKSRTNGAYWLNAIQPENFLQVSAADAKRLDLKDGAMVRIVSRSNPKGEWDLGNGRTRPMVGTVKVLEGLRPGVVNFSLGRGHWANGASDVVVDGKVVKADPRRGTGFHANAAMRLDDHLKNTCLIDPVGGSVSFYDTRVKLVKV